MNKLLIMSLVTTVAFAGIGAEKASLPEVINLEPGRYGGHLQDVCREGDRLYWAHTRTILKTDFSGKVLSSVKDPDHNAGCRVKDGKLYVAVCKRGGRIPLDSRTRYQLQVNVYDAEDLHLIEKKVIEGAYDRAGSLEILPDGSFVIGCLRPPEVREDQVRFYHLTPDLKVISRHEIDKMCAKVKLGIEVIKYYRGDLYFFMYGGDTVRLDAKTFAEKGRYARTRGQVGAIFEDDGFWVGQLRNDEKDKTLYTSYLKKASNKWFQASGEK